MSFTRHGRLYYFDPVGHRPAVGDKVLVPTDDGPVVAECVWPAQQIDEDTTGFPALAGPAGVEHLAGDERDRKKRAEARVAAKKLIKEHDLPMKIVGVDHLESDERTTIYFTAPQRVDFRGLIRDLGATLKRRVELRQLSARDSARIQGGIGSCGRDLCCSTFLSDFEPVTVRMAKDQDLPLNPLRISGACGRLMCCLKYEHPLYAQFKASAPAIGEQVTTDGGSGRVVAHDVPRNAMTVRLDRDGSRCSCSLAGVCDSRREYDKRDRPL